MNTTKGEGEGFGGANGSDTPADRTGGTTLQLRASSFGSCIRAQVATALGFPTYVPDWLQVVYDSGHTHEAEALAVMADQGWNVVQQYAPFAVDEGQVYGVVNAGGVPITTHLDGVALAVIDRNLELKSPGAYRKFEKAYKSGDWSDPLAARYSWQVSIGMHLTGLECVVGTVDDGKLSFFVIEVPPRDMGEIETRALEILMAVEGGLPPAVCSQDDGAGCPVAHIFHMPEELEADPILDRIVDDLEQARKMKKEWGDRESNLRDLAVKQLGGREGAETPSSKVTRYSSTRKSYDYEAIALNLKPGVTIDDFITEKATESVRITKKEGGET